MTLGTRLPILVAALVAATALAGCSGSDDGNRDDQPALAPTLPAGTFVHGLDADAVRNLTTQLPALVAEAFGLGVEAFEPTIGADPEGALFFATVPESGVAVGFGPDVHRSLDGGVSWESVGPRLPTGQPVPPETNDPYIYVDPVTGRVFQFAMAPILLCSILSFSDDQGTTWTTNPKGCGASPPWDHQTMVTAVPRAPAQTLGYPNVVVTCVNSVYAIMCAQSLDGGLTFGPAIPASTDGAEPCATTTQVGDVVVPGPASSLHGHLKASPDGVLYIPEVHCGTPRVHVSADSGLTWTTTQVLAGPVQGAPDPVIAVDSQGTAYYGAVAPNGTLLMAVSTDNGATWSDPVVASPPGVSASLPAMAAVGPGQVAIAYPGTEDFLEPARVDATAENVTERLRWNAYVTIVQDAASPTPTFHTVRQGDATDPLVRGPCGEGGRCPGLVDFIDVVVHAGTVYAAFVDACQEPCVTDGLDADNAGQEGILVRVKDAFPTAPAPGPSA